MESKTEEIKIVLNENLQPRFKFNFSNLESILSVDENAAILGIEKKIYHCSSDIKSNKYIDELDGLNVIKGYYKAYVNHIPICVTPDILWMLIVQGFSRHIDLNAEKLRAKFVEFQGQKEIVVSGDEYAIEDITKEGWERTFNEFVEQIREKMGNHMIDLLTPNFTTTTPTIQVSSQIAIMSAFKSYFKFLRLYGGCGFPFIKLEGTLSDYMQLKNKIQGLMGFEIDDWIKELIIIVDKIIETKNGKIDKKFWENILKNVDVIEPRGSGELTKVTKIDGWLLNFYPYIKINRMFTETIERRFNFNQPLDIEGEIEKFPEEFIEAPLTMYNVRTGEKTELGVKTGILGVVQEKDGIVKAEIGWYISNKIDKDKIKEKFMKKKDKEDQ